MTTAIAPEHLKKINRWRADPVWFAQTQLQMEPDPAQLDLLTAFADPAKQRIAMKACKGPGKTAGLAACSWNFLATRKYPKIAATSISGDNLDDNLWPEMAKWQQNSKFLSQKFTWTKSRIFANDHPERWWMSRRTWSRTADANQQANTLAGLHEENTMAVLDESGSIPRAVMTTAEATLSTVGGEHRILQAGNPTDMDGPLYDACTVQKDLWYVIEITGDPDSPRRSARISIQWAREQIKNYGADNPWVLVNVFGQFPSVGLNTLLGPDQVSEAMNRVLVESQYVHAPKIIGVDPGRFGGARTVMFPRQGLAWFNPFIMRPDRSQRNWTGIVAARIAQAIDKWEADAVFIDDTGGWGAGIIDSLTASGHPVIAVNFAGKAIDPRYYNRRAEMHFLAAENVKDGGCLPNVPGLQREATAPKFWFHKGQFQIEEKEQVMITLGGESPDLWDAGVLTFAQPVQPKTGLPWIDNQVNHVKIEEDERDVVYEERRW
jgi:phage terminase large subunit